MEFTSRFLGSVAGVAGVSTAVGVPVVLNVSSNKERLNDDLPGSGISKISISECSLPTKDSQTKIEFGSLKEGNICGKINSDGNSFDSSREYTEFFTKRGDLKDADGGLNTYQNKWTKQCIYPEITSQWIISPSESSQGNNFQYLGLCENVKKENTKFVKKSKEGGNYTLTICKHNCWKVEDASTPKVPITLTEEHTNSGNWKKVEFFKNIV